MNYLSIIFHSGPIVFMVLLILIGFSVASWAIIIYKLIQLKAVDTASSEFIEKFWRSSRLDAIYKLAEDDQISPQAQVFKAAYMELVRLQRRDNEIENQGSLKAVLNKKDIIERVLSRAMSSQLAKMEKYVSFLGTTASATPFIGLFGTVLGIINSFHEIGKSGSASLAVVAPGISEALIATAVGLAAAIPAVIAFNHFVARIKVIEVELNNFCSDFLNILEKMNI